MGLMAVHGVDAAATAHWLWRGQLESECQGVQVTVLRCKEGGSVLMLKSGRQQCTQLGVRGPGSAAGGTPCVYMPGGCSAADFSIPAPVMMCH